jgi:hypothetical protein
MGQVSDETLCPLNPLHWRAALMLLPQCGGARGWPPVAEATSFISTNFKFYFFRILEFYESKFWTA